jgi:NADH-quinone oxidoreductase subunit M
MLGAFKANPWAGVFAVSGVVLGAVTCYGYQRVIFGPLKNKENESLTTFPLAKLRYFVPLLVLMLIVGLYPKPLLTCMEKSVETTLAGGAENRLGPVAPPAMIAER